MNIGSAVGQIRDTFEIRQIAGRRGLWRSFTCPYQSDDPTNLEFLRGGELVISTGSYYTGDSKQLLSFIDALLRHHTCGLILNLGKYYKESDITLEIRRFCDRAEYPLFVMPWHIALYDVTRACYDLLFHQSWEQNSLTHAFHMVISGETLSESGERMLKACGFRAEMPFYIVYLSGPDSSARTDYILSGILSAAPFPCHMDRESSGYVLICQSESEADAEQLLLRIREELASVRIQAGISDRGRNLTELGKNYRQARLAYRLADRWQKSPVYYNEAGAFRIFLEMQNDQYLRDYADRLLAPLLSYDQKHRTDFAETLRLYLCHSGNIRQIAELTFFHRNTIIHRIKLIREMGYDLADPDVRYELMTAFRIREYLGLLSV